MAAQLDHGGEFATLLQGGPDGGGGRLVDDEHAVSMGSPEATGKRASVGGIGSSNHVGTAQARRPLAPTPAARASSWTR